MRKNYTRFGMLIAIGVISLLQACQKDGSFNSQLNSNELLKTDIKANLVNTLYSSTLPIGNGVVRPWVSQNIDGDPVAVGDNALQRQRTWARTTNIEEG